MAHNNDLASVQDCSHPLDLDMTVPAPFLDIDAQKDFMMPGGCLCIKGAQSITHDLAELSHYVIKNRLLWVATMDSHLMKDTTVSPYPDFKTTFPPHRINKTPGEERIAETCRKRPLVLEMNSEPLEKMRDSLHGNQDSVVFKKNKPDVFANEKFDTLMNLIGSRVFIVFGVAKDYCVKYAVEGLLNRNFKVVVVKNAVYAIDRESETKLFSESESQGAELLETDKILATNLQSIPGLFG